MARLRSHRRELIAPKVAEYKGRIVKTTGDGILIEFPSVVEAVACAIAVQQGMAERNAAIPEHQRIVFRVGINLGDVIVEDGDIHGDGVNVAARLEGIAEPGGICVSAAVRDQEYFADGMVEEIITALSRIRWLFVIARKSAFAYKGQAIDVKRVGRELGVHYVLEGSVRKGGGHVRITTQLIEAETGAHLWADRFDGTLENVFDLQDQGALNVAGIIEPTVQEAEVRRARQRPIADPTAYDLYLRAGPEWLPYDKDQVMRTLGLLEQAIARAPRYAPALAVASHCRQEIDRNNWTDDPAENRRNGLRLARRALQCGPSDPVVLVLAGFSLGYFNQDVDVAIRLVDRALALNPSYARGWALSGVLNNYAGRTETAIENIETALRLDPRDDHGSLLCWIGVADFFDRRFEEALQKFLLSLEEQPTYTLTFRFLAACYAHMGRLREASQVIERLRSMDSAVFDRSAMRYRNSEHRELYLSGLRLAIGETA